jgi:hypothetical protein
VDCIREKAVKGFSGAFRFIELGFLEELIRDIEPGNIGLAGKRRLGGVV